MEVSASKFKATCLKLMDQVSTTGESIVITKRGKPIARLVSARPNKKPTTIYGCMKGSVLHMAPVEELFSTGEDWSVDVGG